MRPVFGRTACHFATDRVTAYPGLSTGSALPTPAMTLAAIEAHGGQPPSRNPGRGIDARRIPNATACRNGSFGFHDAPCQTPHTALCHGRLSQKTQASTPSLGQFPMSSFERVSAALTPWGMARYRLRQPPARLANISDCENYQTGMASALPGGTGELVDLVRLELTTSRLQGGCSPN